MLLWGKKFADYLRNLGECRRNLVISWVHKTTSLPRVQVPPPPLISWKIEIRSLGSDSRSLVWAAAVRLCHTEVISEGFKPPSPWFGDTMHVTDGSEECNNKKWQGEGLCLYCHSCKRRLVFVSSSECNLVPCSYFDDSSPILNLGGWHTLDRDDDNKTANWPIRLPIFTCNKDTHSSPDVKLIGRMLPWTRIKNGSSLISKV